MNSGFVMFFLNSFASSTVTSPVKSWIKYSLYSSIVYDRLRLFFSFQREVSFPILPWVVHRSFLQLLGSLKKTFRDSYPLAVSSLMSLRALSKTLPIPLGLRYSLSHLFSEGRGIITFYSFSCLTDSNSSIQSWEKRRSSVPLLLKMDSYPQPIFWNASFLYCLSASWPFYFTCFYKLARDKLCQGFPKVAPVTGTARMASAHFVAAGDIQFFLKLIIENVYYYCRFILNSLKN